MSCCHDTITSMYSLSQTTGHFMDSDPTFFLSVYEKERPHVSQEKGAETLQRIQECPPSTPTQAWLGQTEGKHSANYSISM